MKTCLLWHNLYYIPTKSWHLSWNPLCNWRFHDWCNTYMIFMFSLSFIKEKNSLWCTIFCYFILFFIFHCLFLVLCVDSACLILFSVPYVRSHDLYNKRHMSWSLFIFKWLIVLLILLLLSAIYVYAFFS